MSCKKNLINYISLDDETFLCVHSWVHKNIINKMSLRERKNKERAFTLHQWKRKKSHVFGVWQHLQFCFECEDYTCEFLEWREAECAQ